MAHDVIMPMLGMVQDTGIIVSWHKQPGDAVKATDILMEVETDKATVEVEAGFDGFLAAVRAETGVPVPVGDVVAVISEDKSDVEAASDSKPEAPAAAVSTESTATDKTEPVAEKIDAKTPAPALEPPPAPAPSTGRRVAQTGGRILASPKARRLARERGIDLGRAVGLGVPEPIHVADLDKLGNMVGPATTASVMRVRIKRAPFDGFLEWVADEAGVAVDGLYMWAAFAAGSLRAATGISRDDDIVVDASLFAGTAEPVSLRNPDCAGLSGITTETTAGAAALTVLDLTRTMLTEYRPAGERPLPHLTICNGEDAANFDLYLEFDPAWLPAETAYAFLKDLADRTQVPLRHLL